MSDLSALHWLKALATVPGATLVSSLYEASEDDGAVLRGAVELLQRRHARFHPAAVIYPCVSLEKALQWLAEAYGWTALPPSIAGRDTVDRLRAGDEYTIGALLRFLQNRLTSLDALEHHRTSAGLTMKLESLLHELRGNNYRADSVTSEHTTIAASDNADSARLSNYSSINSGRGVAPTQIVTATMQSQPAARRRASSKASAATPTLRDAMQTASLLRAAHDAAADGQGDASDAPVYRDRGPSEHHTREVRAAGSMTANQYRLHEGSYGARQYQPAEVNIGGDNSRKIRSRGVNKANSAMAANGRVAVQPPREQQTHNVDGGGPLISRLTVRSHTKSMGQSKGRTATIDAINQMPTATGDTGRSIALTDRASAEAAGVAAALAATDSAATARLRSTVHRQAAERAPQSRHTGTGTGAPAWDGSTAVPSRRATRLSRTNSVVVTDAVATIEPASHASSAPPGRLPSTGFSVGQLYDPSFVPRFNVLAPAARATGAQLQSTASRSDAPSKAAAAIDIMQTKAAAAPAIMQTKAAAAPAIMQTTALPLRRTDASAQRRTAMHPNPPSRHGAASAPAARTGAVNMSGPLPHAAAPARDVVTVLAPKSLLAEASQHQAVFSLKRSDEATQDRGLRTSATAPLRPQPGVSEVVLRPPPGPTLTARQAAVLQWISQLGIDLNGQQRVADGYGSGAAAATAMPMESRDSHSIAPLLADGILLCELAAAAEIRVGSRPPITQFRVGGGRTAPMLTAASALLQFNGRGRSGGASATRVAAKTITLLPGTVLPHSMSGARHAAAAGGSASRRTSLALAAVAGPGGEGNSSAETPATIPAFNVAAATKNIELALAVFRARPRISAEHLWSSGELRSGLRPDVAWGLLEAVWRGYGGAASTVVLAEGIDDGNRSSKGPHSDLPHASAANSASAFALPNARLASRSVTSVQSQRSQLVDVATSPLARPNATDLLPLADDALTASSGRSGDIEPSGAGRHIDDAASLKQSFSAAEIPSGDRRHATAGVPQQPTSRASSAWGSRAPTEDISLHGSGSPVSADRDAHNLVDPNGHESDHVRAGRRSAASSIRGRAGALSGRKQAAVSADSKAIPQPKVPVHAPHVSLAMVGQHGRRDAETGQVDEAHPASPQTQLHTRPLLVPILHALPTVPNLAFTHASSSSEIVFSASIDGVRREKVRDWVECLHVVPPAAIATLLPRHRRALPHLLDDVLLNGTLLAALVAKIEPRTPPLGGISPSRPFTHPRTIGEARANIEAALSTLRASPRATGIVSERSKARAVSERKKLLSLDSQHLWCGEAIVSGDTDAAWALLTRIFEVYGVTSSEKGTRPTARPGRQGMPVHVAMAAAPTAEVIPRRNASEKSDSAGDATAAGTESIRAPHQSGRPPMPPPSGHAKLNGSEQHTHASSPHVHMTASDVPSSVEYLATRDSGDGGATHQLLGVSCQTRELSSNPRTTLSSVVAVDDQLTAHPPSRESSVVAADDQLITRRPSRSHIVGGVDALQRDIQPAHRAVDAVLIDKPPHAAALSLPQEHHHPSLATSTSSDVGRHNDDMDRLRVRRGTDFNESAAWTSDQHLLRILSWMKALGIELEYPAALRAGATTPAHEWTDGTLLVRVVEAAMFRHGDRMGARGGAAGLVGVDRNPRGSRGAAMANVRRALEALRTHRRMPVTNLFSELDILEGSTATLRNLLEDMRVTFPA